MSLMIGEMAMVNQGVYGNGGDTDDSNCGDVNCSNDEVMRIILTVMLIIR